MMRQLYYFFCDTLKLFFILLIKLYQYFISPFLGMSCRFQPTCSEYAINSFKAYGVIKGFCYSFMRIIRCNPFGSHGFDPISHNHQGKDKCQIKD